MKIVIDIPKDHKRVIDNLVIDGKGYLLPYEVEDTLAKAVKQGTPLPKGHGRLKDENEIKQMIEDAKVENESSKNFAENIIKFAPAIIEADKEGEEDGQIKDRRGGDLKDCKLYEQKDGKKAKYVYSIKKG